MQASKTDRHFGMDWLRIAAFGLLIFYHIGMAFVPWPFEIKVSEPLDWVAIPMMFTNPWRLSLLFAISGYASAAMWSHGGQVVGTFVRGRIRHLGLPLLFAMLVIVTPQPWITLVTQHGYTHGFGYFLLHEYYCFQFLNGIAMPTWMHLWFVAYLLVYTLVFGAMLSLPNKWLRSAKHYFETVLASAMLLPAPIAGVWLARAALSPGWSDTHGLLDDWSAHATYLSMFLFGAVLRQSAAIRQAIAHQWPVALTVFMLAYLGLAGFEFVYPGTTPVPHGLRAWYNLLRAISCWSAIVACIGIAERYANHDHRWRAPLAEAVFPLYIIHQTIIVVVGYWLLQTNTGSLERFLVLLAATLGGCWSFYTIGRQINPIRPFLGLKTKVKPDVQ